MELIKEKLPFDPNHFRKHQDRTSKTIQIRYKRKKDGEIIYNSTEDAKHYKNCIKRNRHYFKGKLQRIFGIERVQSVSTTDTSRHDATIVEYRIEVSPFLSKLCSVMFERYIYQSLKKNKCLFGLGDVVIIVL